jgi:hypothetical protein
MDNAAPARARRLQDLLAARGALPRTLAFAAVVVLGAALPLAHAADRFAIRSGTIVPRDAGQTATPASPPGSRFGVRTGEGRGAGDSIFADGFDLSISYDFTFPSNVPLGDQSVELGSVSVPAGSYAVFVRLQARTGDDPNPGNNYRLDCELSPAIDYDVYRVGVEPLVERYLTYQGAVTLDTDGTIGFSCRSANQHEATALSGKLTVLSVGGLD